MQTHVTLITTSYFFFSPVATEVLKLPRFNEETDMLINGKEVEILIFTKK